MKISTMLITVVVNQSNWRRKAAGSPARRLASFGLPVDFRESLHASAFASALRISFTGACTSGYQELLRRDSLGPCRWLRNLPALGHGALRGRTFFRALGCGFLALLTAPAGADREVIDLRSALDLCSEPARHHSAP